jgi:hypothetical protein
VSHSLHRAVSAYLDAVRHLQAGDRTAPPNLTPLIDALHRASGDLYPLLEGTASADLLDQMRAVDDGFEGFASGIVSFAELQTHGPGIVRELEQLQRECEPSPARPDAAGITCPSLQLLLAECPPQPPEPPFDRIQCAALFVTDMLSKSRLTAHGERELRLSAVAGLPRQPGAMPGVDGNGYRWAVRRMVEAGLATVEMAVPPPAWNIEELNYRRRNGLPVKGRDGNYLPDVLTAKPPVPYIRSNPELWERWRAGVMFPKSPSTKPNGRKKKTTSNPPSAKAANLDQLQRRVVELHVPNTSNADTAEKAAQDDTVKRLAKELGKEITAAFVQSCRTAQRNKSKPKPKRA